MITQAKINRVKAMWLGIPDSWKRELASAFHTFIPVFMTTLYLAFQAQPNAVWTKETLLSVGIAAFLSALRAGFKAVSIWFFSRYLPDPKN